MKGLIEVLRSAGVSEARILIKEDRFVLKICVGRVEVDLDKLMNLIQGLKEQGFKPVSLYCSEELQFVEFVQS